MISVFQADGFASKRHMTGNGPVIDLHGYSAKRHFNTAVLRQAEAQALFEELTFRSWLVVEGQSSLVPLQRQPLHQIDRTGIAAGELP